MTYKQLKQILDHMSERQLDLDITIELLDETEGYEYLPADIQFTGNHVQELDENHPIICPTSGNLTDEMFETYIGSLIGQDTFK